MKYKNYVFDLYGTLVDIHTDEEAPAGGHAYICYPMHNGSLQNMRCEHFIFTIALIPYIYLLTIPARNRMRSFTVF